jgi:hypothetical protein
MGEIKQQGPLFGCSDCDWVFKSSGPPIGATLPKMLEQLAKEFDLHDCRDYSRSKQLTPS